MHYSTLKVKGGYYKMDAVKLWLIICSVLVIIILWIGGVTRLTSSGLSITEWKPVTGIIPPLTEQSWFEEKAKYKNTPEYKKVNFDISMSEFKKIYLIEYTHRIFARLIGVVFLLPFIYFLIKKKLDRKTIILLSIALVLGAFQGFIGWYMVQSGLVNQPNVSQYRLTLHLLLATAIFSLFWWQVCENNKRNYIIITTKNYKYCKYLLLTIILMIASQIGIGGLVSGLKAGLLYNTFPLIDGDLIPNNLLDISPIWRNLFENTQTVQFLHRSLGILILINAIALYYLNKTALNLLIIITIQVILGILTLIYQVPIILASSHQVIAIITLAIAIFYYRIIINDEKAHS